jgi:cyclophilin family peptidyl-prolyl cis-trans isomerase
VARLQKAYARGDSDATPTARLAALDALARYDSPAVVDTLTRALADREWPVRLRAAALLNAKGVASAAPERPAPLRQDPAFFESDRLLHPPYSPQAYLETEAGTIQIELDVVDTPLTAFAFVELARAGFFNGIKVHRLIPNFVVQAGDPRGDGEGGPGYTIRDELDPRPFVRGTVGMALGGAETGGSQFFIALSPQPHLDGRYAAFGRVVAGWDVLDRVSLWDVIRRVTIQDGR